MIIVDKKVQQYCADYTSPPPQLLQDLDRETHLKTMLPQMLSGPVQGRLLHFLVQLHQPKSILELGTFTGYATLFMAEALPDNGKIISVDYDEEILAFANKYIQQTQHKDKIKLTHSSVLDFLSSDSNHYDFVFIDAHKTEYIEYYKLIIDRVNSGGLIIADNVLWSQKVVYERSDTIARTLHEFNEMILADDRVENLLLPFRDGFNIIRKK